MEQKSTKSTAPKEPLRIRMRRLAVRWLCRGLVILLVWGGLFLYNGYAHLDRIFSGPSDTAKLRTLEYLNSDNKTAWIPGLFLSNEEIASLRGSGSRPEKDDPSQNSYIRVESEMYRGTPDDEWADWPDGIQIRKIGGPSYQAYAILIRDPSRVYLGLSNPEPAPSLPGKTIAQIMEEQDAVVAINAAEFNRSLSDIEAPGSKPLGQLVSNGRIAWDSGAPRYLGFVGLNNENTLCVEAEPPTVKEIVRDMEIRDGCSTGPVLLEDGKVRERVLKQLPQIRPQSAIGQREDGTVIFLCLDGWQPSSMGGTLLDLARLMKDLDAVTACALDGGNSTQMMYRDSAGKFGPANEIYMVNSRASLQSELEPMPSFWLVQSVKED